MLPYDLNSSYQTLTEGFITESRKTLGGAMTRIEHCLGQLSTDDIWWRPHADANAIGNLVLHLAGNLGQWIISGVGGEPFDRDRPAEFASRETVSATELAARLRATIERVDSVLARLTEQRLVEPRRIQGYDTTVVAAVYHAVTHCEGHAQEIVYVTRMRLGPSYEFLWKPKV